MKKLIALVNLTTYAVSNISQPSFIPLLEKHFNLLQKAWMDGGYISILVTEFIFELILHRINRDKKWMDRRIYIFILFSIEITRMLIDQVVELNIQNQR